MLIIDPVREVGGGFGGNREVPGYFGAFSLYSSLVDSAITVTDQQDGFLTVTFEFETDMQVSEITATAIVDANTSVNLSNPAHSTSIGQTGTVHTYTWTRTVSRTPSEYRGYYRGTFDESIRIYVRVDNSGKSYVYGDTFENNTTQQLYYQVVRKQYAPFLAAPDAMIYTNYWPTPWGADHRVGASSLDSDSGDWTIEEKYSAAIRSDRPEVDGGVDREATIVGVSLNSDFPSDDIQGEGGYWNVSKKIYNWSKYLRDHPDAHSGLAPGEPLETYDQVRFTYSNMYGSNSETRWQWLRIYPDIMTPTLSLSPNTNTITKKVLPGQKATYTVEATAQDDASIRSITASIVSSGGSGALTQITASEPEDQPTVNVWEGGSGIWTTKRDFTFTVQAEGNLTASKTYTHTVSWTAKDHIGRESSPQQIQFTTVATDETGPTVNGVTFNPSSLTLVTGDEDKPVEVTIDAADNYSADASLTSAVVAKIGQTTVASDSGDGLVRTLSFSHDSAGVQGGSNTVSFVTTVKDQFTNSTSKSYNFTLVADQKPTIDSVTTTNLTLAVGATSGTVTTTVNASDDIGLKKIRLLRGNVQIGSANVSGKSATQPFTEAFQRSDFTPSDTAYPGSYTIEVTDTADQKATTTADYEISVTRDTEKPVVVDLDQYYKVYDPVQFGYSGNWIALAHDATLDMSNLEGILLKYEAKATDNDQIASFVVSWPENTEGFVQMPPAEIAEDGRSATLTLQRMVSRPGELTSPDATPEDGLPTVSLHVKPTDRAGNFVTRGTKFYMRRNDITAPSITDFSLTPESSNSHTLKVGGTATVGFTCSAKDSESAIESIELTSYDENDVNNEMTSSEGVFTRTFTRTFTYAGGNVTKAFGCGVKDEAGNTTSSTQITVSIIADGLPQISSFTADKNSVNLNNGNNQVVDFTITATDTVGIKKIELLKGNTSMSSATVSGGPTTATRLLSYTYNRSNFSVLDSGTDYFSARITDTSDQVVTTPTDARLSVSYTVPDNQAPAPSIEITHVGDDAKGTASAIVDLTHKTQLVVKYKVTATDDVAPHGQFNFAEGQADDDSITALDSGWGYTFTRTFRREDFTEPSTQTRSTQVTVSDQAGNTSNPVSADVTVKLDDITPPTFVAHLYDNLSNQPLASSADIEPSYTLTLDKNRQSVRLYWVVNASDASEVGGLYTALEWEYNATVDGNGKYIANPSNRHLRGSTVYAHKAWPTYGPSPRAEGYDHFYTDISIGDYRLQVNYHPGAVLRWAVGASDEHGNDSKYTMHAPIYIKVIDEKPSINSMKLSTNTVALGGSVQNQTVTIDVDVTDDIHTLENGDVTLSYSHGGAASVNVPVFSRANESNKWSFTDTISAVTAAGDRVYTAIVWNEVSSTFVESASANRTLVVTRDDQAPVNLSLRHNNPGGSNLVRLNAANDEITLTFTADSDSSDVAEYYFESQFDSNSKHTPGWSSNSTYDRLINASSFTEGLTHTLTVSVKAKDGVGNETQPVPVTLTIIKDTAAPTITGLAHNLGSIVYLTNDTPTTGQLTFAASDVVTNISTSNVVITATRDGSSFTNNLSLTGGSQSGDNFTYGFTLTRSDFPEGVAKDVVFNVQVTDDSSKSSNEEVTVRVLTDTTAPSYTTLRADPSSFVFNETNSDTRDVTITVEASDGGSGLKTIKLDGVAGTISNGQATFTRKLDASSYTNNTSNVETSFSVEVEDNAGNKRPESVSVLVTRDETKPDITFSVSPTTVTFVEESQSQLLELRMTATDAVGFVGGEPSFSVPSSWSYSGYDQTDNRYVYHQTISASSYENNKKVPVDWTASVTDKAGNTRPVLIRIHVTKDKTHPTIAIATVEPNLVEFTSPSGTEYVIVTVAASDAMGLKSMSVDGATAVDGETNKFRISVSGNDSKWQTPGTSDTISITARAEDTNGNTSSETLKDAVTVRQLDTTKPLLSIAPLAGQDATVDITSRDQTVTKTVRITASDADTALDGAPTLTANDARVAVGAVTPVQNETGVWEAVLTFREDKYRTASNITAPGQYIFSLSSEISDTAVTPNTANASLPYTVSVADFTAPIIDTAGITINPATVVLSGGNDKQVEISVTITDDASPLVAPTLDGNQPSSTSQINSYSSRYTFHKTFKFNDYNEGYSNPVGLGLVATDAAGQSTPHTIAVPVTKPDETAPTFTVQVVEGTSITFGADTSNQQRTFTATNIVETVGVAKMSLDMGTSITGSPLATTNSAPWTLQADFSAGTPGTTNVARKVTVRLEDAAVPPNTRDETVTILATTLDVTAPVVTNSSQTATKVTFNQSTRSATVDFTLEITDDSGSFTVQAPAGLVKQSDYVYRKTFEATNPSYLLGETVNDFTDFVISDGASPPNTTPMRFTVAVENTDFTPPYDLSVVLSASYLRYNASGGSDTVLVTATFKDDHLPDSATCTEGFSQRSKDYDAATGVMTVVFERTFRHTDYTPYFFGTVSPQVTAYDKSGNYTVQTEVTSMTVEYDNDPPDIVKVEHYVNNVTGADVTWNQSETDGYRDVYIKVWGADPESGYVHYTAIDGYYYMGWQDGAHIFGLRWYTSGDPGTYNMHTNVVLLDRVGNRTEDNSYYYVIKIIDDVPPVFEVAQSRVSSISLTANGPTNTVVFDVKASDLRGPEPFISHAGATFHGLSSEVQGAYEYRKTFSMYNSNNQPNYEFNKWVKDGVTFVATDAAGLTTSQTVEIDIYCADVDKPSIDLIEVDANQNAIMLTGQKPSITVTLTVKISDAADLFPQLSISGGWIYDPSPSGNNTYYYTKTYSQSDTSNYPFGQTTDDVANVTVTDDAGNSDSTTFTIYVTNGDTISPSVSGIHVSPQTIVLGTGDTREVNVSTEAADAQTGIDTDNCSLVCDTLPTGLQVVKTVSGSTVSFKMTWTYSLLDGLALGTYNHSLAIAVQDGAGNKTTTEEVNLAVTKTDVIKPQIENLSIVDSNGNGLVAVTLTDAEPTKTVYFIAKVSDNHGLASTTATRTQPGVADANISPALEHLSATINSSYGPYLLRFEDFGTDDTSSSTTVITFTLSALDLATPPNTHSATASLTVNKVNQAPVFSLSNVTVSSAEINLYSHAPSGTVTISATITDFSPVQATCIITESGEQLARKEGETGDTYTWEKSYTYDSEAFNYADGSPAGRKQTYVVSATDGVLTTARSAEAHIKKIDTENPTIVVAVDGTTSFTVNSVYHEIVRTYSATITDNNAIVGTPTLQVRRMHKNPWIDITSQEVTYLGKVGNVYSWLKKHRVQDYDEYRTHAEEFHITAVDAAGRSSNSVTLVHITKENTHPHSGQGITTNMSGDVVSLKSSSKSFTVAFQLVVQDDAGVATDTSADTVYKGTFVDRKTLHESQPWWGSESLAASAAGANYGSQTELTAPYGLIYAYAYNPGNENQVLAKKAVYRPDGSVSQVQDVVLGTQGDYSFAVKAGLLLGSLDTTYLPSGTQVALSSAGVVATYSWSEVFNYADYAYGNSSVSRVVSVTDGSMQTSQYSWSATVSKIDDEQPQIASATAAPSTVNLTQQTKTIPVTITVVASDNRAVTELRLDALNGAPSFGQASISGNTYTFTKSFSWDDFTLGAPASPYQYTATATDAAGLTRQSSIVGFTVQAVDQQDPVVHGVTVSPSSFSLRDGQTQVVNAVAEVSDDNAIATVTIAGYAHTTTTTSDGRQQWRFSRTYAWSDLPKHGSNTIAVTAVATDSSGLTGDKSVNLYGTNIDSVAPNVTSFSSFEEEYKLSPVGHQTNTIRLSASYSDNLNSQLTFTATEGLTVSSDGTTLTKQIAVGDYAYGDTQESYTLTATDSDGNTSQPASVTVKIRKFDDQSPIISNFAVSPSSITLSASNPTVPVTVVFNATDNVGVTSVVLPGYGTPSIVGTQYTHTRVFNYENYRGTADMTQEDTAKITVEDGSSHPATKQVKVDITVVDEVKPGIANVAVSGATVTTSNQTAPSTIAATITDDWQIASAYLKLDGQPVGALSTAGSVYTWTINHNYVNYSYGSNTVEYDLEATDNNGLSRVLKVSETITKQDDQSPVIQSFSSTHSDVTLSASGSPVLVKITADISENVAIYGLPTLTASGFEYESQSSHQSFVRYVWRKTYVHGAFPYGGSKDEVDLEVADTTNNKANDQLVININQLDEESPVIHSLESTVSRAFMSGSQTESIFHVYANITDNAGPSTLDFSQTEGAVYDADKTAEVGGTNIYYFKVTLTTANTSPGYSFKTITIKASDGINAVTERSIGVEVRRIKTAGTPIIRYVNANAATVDLDALTQSVTVAYVADIISDGPVTATIGTTSLAPVSSPTAQQQENGGGQYTFQFVYRYADFPAGTADPSPDMTVTATGTTGTDSLAHTTSVVKVEDTQAPTISLLTATATNLSFRRGDDASVVTFTVNATDNYGIKTVSAPDLTFTEEQSGVYTASKTYQFDFTKAGTIVPDVINVTAEDLVGKTDVASITVEIHYLDFRELAIASNQQVRVEANLNASVFKENGYLGFLGGRLSSDNTSAVYSLPAGKATFACGDITGIGLDGQSVGTLTGMITVETDGQGMLSANVEFTGGPLIASVNEDVNLTQVVQWDVEPTLVVTSTTADQLQAEFTTIDASTYYADIIKATEDLYAGSAIKSWTFEVSRIAASRQSPINEYSVHRGRESRGVNVFDPGEHIALATAQRYSLSVADINGQEVMIVPAVDVYAIITHNPDAPPLADLPVSGLLFPGGMVVP